MLSLVSGLAVVILAAMASAAEAQRSAAPAADSLVLVRTPCFGTCPAYRLSLTSAGEITFAPLNLGELRQARDTVGRATLATLVQRAESIGFFALPERLTGDATLCPIVATDHPTVILTIFRAGRARMVEDYTGCFIDTDHGAVDAVMPLRALEAAVDSATYSHRWVRPRLRGR